MSVGVSMWVMRVLSHLQLNDLNEQHKALREDNTLKDDEVASFQQRLDDITLQLAASSERHTKANAKAEEQATRADEWESQCIGNFNNHSKDPSTVYNCQ